MCARRTCIRVRRLAAAIVLSVFSVSVASAQTPETSGVTVREHDPLINGALIGAGSAVGFGLFMCTRMEPWRNCRDDFGTMVKLGAIGAGIGMGIDALIRRKVYQSASGETEVHAAPLIGRRATGLRLSVTF